MLLYNDRHYLHTQPAGCLAAFDCCSWRKALNSEGAKEEAVGMLNGEGRKGDLKPAPGQSLQIM